MIVQLIKDFSLLDTVSQLSLHVLLVLIKEELESLASIRNNGIDISSLRNFVTELHLVQIVHQRLSGLQTRHQHGRREHLYRLGLVIRHRLEDLNLLFHVLSYPALLLLFAQTDPHFHQLSCRFLAWLFSINLLQLFKSVSQLACALISISFDLNQPFRPMSVNLLNELFQ